MKTTTPNLINRRDELVDNMARKLADGDGVGQIITAYRKRRIKPMKYVYTGIALSVVSMSATWLVMTGRVTPPGFVERHPAIAVAPVKNTVDLLNEDLAMDSISPDRYAIYLEYCLIGYGLLPDRYKTPDADVGSEELMLALYDIWPRVTLRTRSKLLADMPFIERRWERFTVERKK